MPNQTPPRGLRGVFSASSRELDLFRGLGSVQASPNQRGGEREPLLASLLLHAPACSLKRRRI